MALSPAEVSLDLAWPASSDLQVFSAQTRLLVIAPHPDDETIASGVLIQQVRAAGGQVKILLLTAGDNNPWPQRWLERRLRIRTDDRLRWGQRRRAELQQALRQLNLPADALQVLDWPDLGVTDMLLNTTQAAVATMAAAIGAFDPSLVVLPSLADRHPDHGAAHVLVRLALANRPDPPPLFAYLIHGHAVEAGVTENMPPSTAQQATKLAALAAHESQMALSGRRMRRIADRPERHVRLTPQTAITASVLPWRPAAWLQPHLRLDVVNRAGSQPWRWPQAPLHCDQEGRYHLPVSTAVSQLASPGPRFVKLSVDLPSPWIFDRWGWHEV